MELLTVAIPTWNRPAHLERVLRSLADCVDRPRSVVVVARSDDESSRNVAARFAQRLPIRVISPEAPGLIPAVSTALAAAETGFLLLLDDDVQLTDRHVLNRVVEAFSDDKVVAVAGTNEVVGERHKRTARFGNLSYDGRLSGNFYRVDPEALPRRVAHFQGCNVAFRCPVPKVDSRLQADGVYYELGLSLSLQRRGTIVAIPDFHVRHHQAPRGETRSWTDRRVVQSASYNYALVLSTHLRGVRRIAALCQLMVVGQRKVWGPLAIARSISTGELSPRHGAQLLRISIRAKLNGWTEGRR